MNRKIGGIIFVVIVLLVLIKFTFLFTTGEFLGVVVSARWLIWLALVVGIILMWILYGFIFRARYSLGSVVVWWLLGGVLLAVAGIGTGGIGLSDKGAENVSLLVDNSSSVSNLVKCASTDVDKPVNDSEIITDLFVSPLDATRSYTRGVQTETRIFSLADYADEKANQIKDWRNPVEKTTLKEDIFYNIHRADSSSMPGYAGAIQLCDENNMAVSGLDSDPRLTSENAISGTWYLHGSHIPKEPGDYRVDGYLYRNGKWTLTNRIDKITLTK